MKKLVLIVLVALFSVQLMAQRVPSDATLQYWCLLPNLDLQPIEKQQ